MEGQYGLESRVMTALARRNALILSPWREGMLPLSDGLIAPALIDRQPRPSRSPGNTEPALPHTQTAALPQKLTVTVFSFLMMFAAFLTNRLPVESIFMIEM